MSIEGKRHLFTIYFPGFVLLCFTMPGYQVSVYRTIGPLVLILFLNVETLGNGQGEVRLMEEYL